SHGSGKQYAKPAERVRAQAYLREIVRVHELVSVRAVSQSVDGPTAAHPLEENLKDAEASVPEDRARSHDGDVATAGDVAAGALFSGELRRAICLPGRGCDSFVDWIARRHAVDGARRDDDGLVHALAERVLEQRACPFDVHGPELLAVFGQ